MKTEKHGSTIETREDGSTVVRTPGGGLLDLSKDRKATLDLETIQSVGIQNVVEVETHQIARIAGSTSHFIRFHGGGEVRFAYNQQGKLIELSAEHCAFTLTNHNELFFRKATKKA
jgi:hypothetical protein